MVKVLMVVVLALVLLAQPACGVLGSLPAVMATGFAPAELEEVPSSGGDSAPEFDEEFDEELHMHDIWEDRLERFVTRALNLTKGHGGECAVGTGCGAAAGWLLRKLQGAIVTAAVLSSLGAAGACLLCTRLAHPACTWPVSVCALFSFTRSALAPHQLRARIAPAQHPPRPLCPPPSSPRLPLCPLLSCPPCP